MIVFSYFGMLRMLVAVPEYRVTRLYLVTPIMAAMVANQTLLGEYNLSSVRTVLTAAAPSLSGSASVSGAIVPHLEAFTGLCCTVIHAPYVSRFCARIRLTDRLSQGKSGLTENLIMASCTSVDNI